MKSENEILLNNLLCIIIGISLTLILGIGLYKTEVLEFKVPVYEMDLEGGINCNKASLGKTAACIQEYVNKIFDYRDWANTNPLTLNELKRDGGDCLDYTSLYVTYFRQYGHNAKLIQVGNHVFAVAWGEHSYCIADQRECNCYYH